MEQLEELGRGSTGASSGCLAQARPARVRRQVPGSSNVSRDSPCSY
jgi:hypothetical protein